MFGKKKREARKLEQERIEQERLETNKRVTEKILPTFKDYDYFCDWLSKNISLSGKNLQNAINNLANDILHNKKTMQNLPMNTILTGLVRYYQDQLHFGYSDLFQVVKQGLEVGDYYDKNFTEEQVDNWIKEWQEMRAQFQTLVDVCEEFHYKQFEGENYEGKFEPVAGDEKRCALVEKSLRETFEGLLRKDIDKRVEELRQEEEIKRQEEERMHQEAIAQQKEAEEREAKAREERTERINSTFGIGKEK